MGNAHQVNNQRCEQRRFGQKWLKDPRQLGIRISPYGNVWGATAKSLLQCKTVLYLARGEESRLSHIEMCDLDKWLSKQNSAYGAAIWKHPVHSGCFLARQNAIIMPIRPKTTTKW